MEAPAPVNACPGFSSEGEIPHRILFNFCSIELEYFVGSRPRPRKYSSTLPPAPARAEVRIPASSCFFCSAAAFSSARRLSSAAMRCCSTAKLLSGGGDEPDILLLHV